MTVSWRRGWLSDMRIKHAALIGGVALAIAGQVLVLRASKT